jgi:hypothetical protein
MEELDTPYVARDQRPRSILGQRVRIEPDLFCLESGPHFLTGQAVTRSVKCRRLFRLSAVFGLHSSNQRWYIHYWSLESGRLIGDGYTHDLVFDRGCIYITTFNQSGVMSAVCRASLYKDAVAYPARKPTVDRREYVHMETVLPRQ